MTFRRLPITAHNHIWVLRRVWRRVAVLSVDISAILADAA